MGYDRDGESESLKPIDLVGWGSSMKDDRTYAPGDPVRKSSEHDLCQDQTSGGYCHLKGCERGKRKRGNNGNEMSDQITGLE